MVAHAMHFRKEIGDIMSRNRRDYYPSININRATIRMPIGKLETLYPWR
jgi:hypothetical protein